MLDYLIFAGVSVAFLIILIIYLYPLDDFPRYRAMKKRGSKKKTTIPGPDPSDAQEGNLPDVFKAGSLHQYLLKLHETYGTISGFYWGEQFVVSIADPKHFEQQIGVFDKSKDLMQMYAPLISGNALQLTNGVAGRKRHKLLSSFANFEEIRRNVIEVGWNMNRKWRTFTKEDHVPISEYMSALTFKALANMSFGGEISDKQIHEMKQQYDVVWNGMEGTLFSTSGSSRASVDKAYGKLKSSVLSIGQKKKTKGNDLWSALMNECSTESAVCEVLGFITAGYRPVAAWLTWFMYFVAKDPEVQSKIRSELKKFSSVEDGSKVFKLSELKYMRQVLDETLRCASIVAWTSRVQTFDTQIGSHLVPKDTPVIHALGVACQDEDLFPDPECFRPERMNEEEIEALPQLAFSPFGFAGKRVCPGMNVAYLMATAWMAQVVSSFSFKLVGEDDFCPATFGLVSRPEEEVWIGLTTLKD